uniref:fibronectin type III domain-containing protein n=1 Tax=Sphingomonas sp. TaxID=28214 RepID=UPI003B3AC6CE
PKNITRRIAAGASGPVTTLARLLSESSFSRVSGDAALTLSAGGVASLSAGLGVGTAASILVLEEAGDTAVRYRLTLQAAPSVPAAPTLTATAGDARVTLSWVDNGDGGAAIVDHILYAGATPEALEAIGPIGAVGPILLDNLPNGVPVSLAIAAVNSEGAGPRSAVQTVTPSALQLFRFADNFNDAADNLYINRRPGWQVITGDSRTSAFVQARGQALAMFDGNNNAQADGNLNAAFAGVDIGRMDGGYAEARYTAAAAINAYGPAVNYHDRLNWVALRVNSASRIAIVQVLNGVMTILYDSSNRLNAGSYVAPGDRFRLDCDWSTGTPRITLLRNGVPYPQAADVSSGAPSYPLAASAALPRSSRYGVVGPSIANGANGGWDDFEAGHLGSAPLPRLTVDPMVRLYQRSRATGKRALPIAGIAAGVSGMEFRLLQNGAVVPGWDWGEKPLSNLVLPSSGRWTARTPEVDAGDGYQIDVRAINDARAGAITRRFGVGAIVVTHGQSNATPLAATGPVAGVTRAAAPNTYAVAGIRDASGSGNDVSAFTRLQDMQFDGPASGALANSYAGCVLYGAASGAPGIPLMTVGLGLGARRIETFLPSYTTKDVFGGTMTLWEATVYELNALYDPTGVDTATADFEAFVWLQGEDNAGRTLTVAAFGAPEEAAYRANLATLYQSLRNLTGRSTAQLPFVLMGLNRSYSTNPTADAVSPGWTRFRSMQWDVCDPASAGHIAGMFYGGSLMDIQLLAAQAAEPHYLAADRAEVSLRAGYAVARAKGWRANDRRGPIPISLARSGNAITVTFDLQMATGLTCAAAIASQFLFAASNALEASGGQAGLLAIANRVAPSSMAIGAVQGQQQDVTFTFATAPAAGWAMQMYGGSNPQAVVGRDPNALYGQQALAVTGSNLVLAAGAFAPMVVA